MLLQIKISVAVTIFDIPLTCLYGVAHFRNDIGKLELTKADNEETKQSQSIVGMMLTAHQKIIVIA